LRELPRPPLARQVEPIGTWRASLGSKFAMKTFKLIVVTVAVIIAVPLIAAIFIKKDFVIEREIVLNKPKQDVFDYLKHLKNQENYSKWVALDPKTKISYSGTDGTVGFVMAWESDNPDVGKGEQEIKNIAEGDRIDVENSIYGAISIDRSCLHANRKRCGKPNESKNYLYWKDKLPNEFTVLLR
jgi:hypothetical protein